METLKVYNNMYHNKSVSFYGAISLHVVFKNTPLSILTSAT